MKQLFVLAALFVSSLALAQPGPMHRGPMGPGGQGRLIERLNLTSDQEKQVGTLSAILEKKQIALRAKIMAMRVDLRSLYGAENPSKSDIQALQSQMHALRGEVQANRTDFWFEVNKILTPEQRKDWRHALGLMPAKRPMGHGRGNRHLGM